MVVPRSYLEIQFRVIHIGTRLQFIYRRREIVGSRASNYTGRPGFTLSLTLRTYSKNIYANKAKEALFELSLVEYFFCF